MGHSLDGALHWRRPARGGEGTNAAAAARDYSDTLITHGLLVADERDNLVDACEHAEAIFRCSRQDLIGRPLLALFPSCAFPGQWLARNGDLPPDIGVAGAVLRVTAMRPDGERFPATLSRCQLQASGTSVRHFVVGDSSPLQRRLQETERLAVAVEQTGDAIAVTDSRGTIEYVNRSFEEVTGYEWSEARGRSMRLVSSGLHGRDFYRSLWSTLSSGNVFRGRFVNRRKNGELYHEEKTISPIRDGAGRITHYVSTARDVSQQVSIEERLNQLANFDVLTGLPNRNLFLDRLAQAITACGRSGKPVGLLYLDLDRFKLINDTLGHEAGDELLRCVALRLRACLRESDTVARLGGDEFTVILRDLQGLAHCRRVVEKIVAGFAPPFDVLGRALYVSPSIGAAIHPQDGADPATLLKHADIAMYDAKNTGRNGFSFFRPEMSATAQENLALETDLRGAAARQEFALMYQPQVDMLSGRLIGVEALLRWHHPRRGTVMPDTFIRLLEDIGQIATLSEWVISRACRDIARVNSRLGCSLRVAVNLSNGQFKDPRLPSLVEQALMRSGLAPSLLELEITEGTLMENVPATMSALHSLERRGVRLAVDDFGVGHSSLSYLRRFSVDVLKIDRSFVHDAMADDDARSIVRAMVSLGRALEIGIVAEGVETPEQHALLASMGCECAQGFLFGRPMTVDALTKVAACWVPRNVPAG
ncbi:MAG: EAL domain-containing protein [Betaproteobacteria bacterium]|nr:EAL domain-containing protein [Betaproteobacteria bacterium]